MNPIFNVEYEYSESILSLDAIELKSLRKIIFKIFCLKFFENFWIIFLDDLEFADNDSMELFDVLFELCNAFFVITIGKRRKTNKNIRIFNNNRVKWHKLEPIGLSFQKAIACQFLKVAGISLELERYFI
jgi:adenylate cyclase 10